MPDDPEDPNTAGDPSAAGWDLLAAAMERDPMRTANRILRTLETNKIEAKYQDYDKPRIFFKEVDDLGLVISVAVNPHYGRSIPMPRNDFKERHRRRLFDLLETTDEGVLALFLDAAQIEKVILATVLEVTTADVTPPIRKRFNEDGFPVSYQPNWPVKHVYLQGGEN